MTYLSGCMRRCGMVCAACLLVLLAARSAPAWETYIGRSMNLVVKEMLEGNIFTATDSDDNVFTIRFYGIGIPTARQPFGIEAHRQLLAILRPGVRATVTLVNENDEGIYNALVQVADRSVNNRLVSEGLAWVDRKVCKAFFCRRWHIEEHIAQTERRGVWSLNIPTPPWQWSEPKGR